MNAYKYTVNLQVNISGVSPINVTEDNIISLIIDYNYNSEVIIPVVMIKVRLDKNLIDHLIETKDTSRIILMVNKVNVGQEDYSVEEGYINTVCSYELMDDTYSDKTNMYDASSSVKDMYAETVIALISQDCVDRNIRNNDCVLKDGNILGAVGYFTSHMPIVIEPFTYNKEFEQLIIPPLESVKQVIRFLANIAVFYDTPIRFFNDFHKVYLLSSKGKAVEMEDEQASRVVIRMRQGDSTTDPFVQGITYDQSEEWYELVVLTNETVYNKNNIIEKDFNRLIGILDPSRKQSLPGIVGDVISNIIDSVSELDSSIKSNRSGISNGANAAVIGSNKTNYSVGIINDTTREYNQLAKDSKSQYKGLVNKYWNTLKRVINTYNALVSGSTGSGSTSGSSGSSSGGGQQLSIETYQPKYDAAQEHLKRFDEVANDSHEYMMEVARGRVNSQGVADIATKSAYSVTSYESLYNGIKIENLPSNIATMGSKQPINDKYNQLIKGRTDSAKKYMNNSNGLMQKSISKTYSAMHDIKKIVDYFYENIVSIWNKAEALRKAAASSSSSGSGGSSSGDSGSSSGSSSSGSSGSSSYTPRPCPITEEEHDADDNSMDLSISTLDLEKTTMLTHFGNINTNISQNTDFSTHMERTVTRTKSSVEKLGKNLLSSIGESFITSVATSFLTGQGFGGIWEIFTNNLNSLIESTFESGLSELGIGSISDFNNLDDIANLTGAAKVGLTSLITNRLNILDSGAADRFKYIDLGNDDPNRIKVVENEVALSGTTFSITKDNIDNSIITLNKEYLVQNVGMKTELNGRYLLRHKQEIYVREDKLFNARTIMDFLKIPESSS